MSVRSRLEDVGVSLLSDKLSVDWDSVSYKSAETHPVSQHLTSLTAPLVSCLMVTRGDIEIIRYSLACFKKQTYPHRELIVVSEPEAGDRVRDYINSQDVNATVFVPPPGLTVGDHRNLAAARAGGDILVTWDDDDLYDPERLSMAVRTLRESGAAAAFLSRLVIWWPQREIAAISAARMWEQTIAVWRPFMPIYAPLPSGGDTVAIDRLTQTCLIAKIECPLLYFYTVTGRNIWSSSHFELLISRADCVFEGADFRELNEILSDRLPVVDYAATLNERRR